MGVFPLFICEGGLYVEIYRLDSIGKKCKVFRKRLGIKQKQVATETGYGVKSVSAFENGRLNNALILLWYFSRGLDFHTLRGCKYGKETGTICNGVKYQRYNVDKNRPAKEHERKTAKGNRFPSGKCK